MQLQRWWLTACLMVVLNGCTLQAPGSIASGPSPITWGPSSDNPRFIQVRAQPNDYQGHKVRWGGTIAAVENRGEHDTVLIIASRVLNSEGKPLADAGSQGHFMAKVNRFLNPAVYATGQFVTVSGTVVGSESRAIADDPDSYPFVAVDDYYLWPESQQTTAGSYSYHSCSDSSHPYPWSRFGYGRMFKHCP